MRALLASTLLATLALSGCSTTSTMNGIMRSWEGAHLDQVVSQWGYPDAEREFNGNTLYLWRHNKSAYIPSTTTTTGNVSSFGSFSSTSTTTGGYMMQGSCDRILEVDDETNRVVSWNWRGNNCPFMEAMEYSDWRKK